MRTYTLNELAVLLVWHPSSLKVVSRKMNIDPDEPIEEEDAEAIAAKLNRPWPPQGA